jgi:hypothetical protein
MKTTLFGKPLMVAIFTMALLLYGFIVVNAAYPLTQWEPGETLDPMCDPDPQGDPNCSVATAWEIDIVAQTILSSSIFNKIGINVDDVQFGQTVFGDIDPDVHIYGPNRLLLTADNDNTFFLQGDLGDIPGFGDGFLLRNSIGSLFFLDSNIGANLSLTDGDTGARTGLSFRDEVALGRGMMGVIEGKADGTIARRYGFSFWAGRTDGSPDSADHFEFDPVRGLDTKGIFVTEDNVFLTVRPDENITNNTNYNEHVLYLTPENDGEGLMYLHDQNISTNSAATRLLINEGIEFRSGVDVNDILSGTELFSVDPFTGVTNSLGGYTQGSDQRLKTNIQNLTLGLDTINQLRPVDYTMISSDAYQIGFIAQEMQDVIPALVNDSREYLSINYIGVIPVLTKAIQEISAKIDILEQQTIDEGGFSLTSLSTVIKDLLGDIGNGIKNIFAEKIITEELCIEDICFNQQEAEILKQLINAGVIPDTNDSGEESIIEEGLITETPEVSTSEEEIEETEIVEEVETPTPQETPETPENQPGSIE